MLDEELRAAAARGNLQDVTSLLKKGAKLKPDTSGRTPLHLAAAGGHTEIVKALVHPKNVNSPDAVGRTALQVAAAGGHVDVVSLLIKSGANVNSRDNLHGNTAVHEASWHGFSKTVALLAQNKAELDTPNSAGFAALHLCCQNGHNQSCRELLLAGGNPDIQNNYGDTSLHTSARYGHAGVARILISASCRVSDQNKNGDTALHIAAAMGRRKMTTILLEAGCDQKIRNKQYETACDIATRKDLNEIIVILKSVKPHKLNKKKKRSSETSDSDKKSRDLTGIESKLKTCKVLNSSPWSPYGCHYYPDISSFPAPKLDSLPGEPLGKGEQYYLDLAGNIRKGPVGVGLTCHCANFLRDMEARLEKNNMELKHKIKLTRFRLEERVERTEGLIAEWLGEERGRKSSEDSPTTNNLPTLRETSKRRGKHRSQSLDLLQNCADTDTQQEYHPEGCEGHTDAMDLLIENYGGTISDKMKDISLNETVNDVPSSQANMDKEIENLPYRSRTAVYSPTNYNPGLHQTIIGSSPDVSPSSYFNVPDISNDKEFSAEDKKSIYESYNSHGSNLV